MADKRERFQRLSCVFSGATEIEVGTDREAYLEAVCREDPQLDQEVRFLLLIYESEPAGRMAGRIRAAIERAARDLP